MGDEPRRVVGGRYRLGTELGRGGMGVVFRALDERTGREVALKLVPKASVAEWQRLVREGRALAALAHPNIVAVLDAGDAGDQAFLAMTLVNGRSLAERLRTGPLPIAEACTIVEGVARALAHAHGHGVLHRDVKPANVLLEQDGTPRLCDFGLARKAGDGRLTATGEIMGTPSFMAPEQAQGEVGATGPWTDSWGVGALLYAALTARPPFEASNAMTTILQVIERAPAPPSSLRPDVPAALEALCLRCLDKDPTRRPTALQVADSLVGLRAAEGRARQRTTRERPPRPRRSSAIGAGVVAVGVLLALVVVMSQRAPSSGDGDGDARRTTETTAVPTRKVEPATPPPPPVPEVSAEALLEQARQHVEAQELDRAAAGLRRALALRPARTARLRHVVARFGLHLADLEDDAAAVRLVDEALGATPLAADAWGAAAERHASRGELAAARRDGDRALALAPARSVARAWALSASGAWSDRPEEAAAAAIHAAEEAVDSSPDDLEALFVRGYFRLAPPRKERVDLDRVAAGDDPELAALALASIAAVLFDLDAAARACELDADNAWPWASHGYVLASNGRFREALDSLDRALALDPRDIGSLKHRGITRLQLEDARGALADFDALLRLWPDSGDGFLWCVRAVANQRDGRRDAAIADLELALMDPSQRERARAELRKLREPDAGVAELEASATADERIARADVLREHGDLERAHQELERVLRERPSWSVAWGALALVRVHAGDLPGARAAAARCSEANGHQALALTLLHDPASIAAAEAALDARPGDHLARLARALIRRSFGERARAAPDIRAGLASQSLPRAGWSRRTLEALDLWSRGR